LWGYVLRSSPPPPTPSSLGTDGPTDVKTDFLGAVQDCKGKQVAEKAGKG